MTMKQLYSLYSLLVVLFLSSSCEDTLTENPSSYYDRTDFFTTVENANMAVVGIYSTLPTLYRQIDGSTLAASDDTYYPNGTTSDNRRDIGHYVVRSSNAWIESAWAGKYEQLNRANYCIANIEQMNGYAKSTELQTLVGEAKFLRAQALFDLVRYWGDVPFKVTYSSNYENAYQPRTDREEIYNQIVLDLKDAESILPWADASSSPEKATQGAARGLMMRVLLTRAGYSLHLDGTLKRPDNALRRQYFEAVIDEWEAFEENGYHGFYEGGYEALFRSFSQEVLKSKESLFEVAFLYPDAGGNWGTNIGPLVAAPNVGSGEFSNYMGRAQAFFRVVPEWRDFFEADEIGNAVDDRRDVAICTYQYRWDEDTRQQVKKENARGGNWYPGKWRREWMPLGFEDMNLTDVNFCLLRYADVVLMAAEAYNELGNTTEAWRLLNRVRVRAHATQVNSLREYREVQPNLIDLPFFNSGDAADDFRTALYWERGFELAFEGQRKFDLIRWGVLGQALRLFGELTSLNSASGTSYPAGNNFHDGQHELFPIPDAEMEVNHKLQGINNPGY